MKGNINEVVNVPVYYLCDRFQVFAFLLLFVEVMPLKLIVFRRTVSCNALCCLLGRNELLNRRLPFKIYKSVQYDN